MITNSNILSNSSRTLRYPSNINTWMTSQCWYPRVGRFFDTIMDVDYSYHAFTYMLQQLSYKPTPSRVFQRQSVFYDSTSTIQKTLPPWEPTKCQCLIGITILKPTSWCFYTIMDVDYSYHALTYIPQPHRYNYIHHHVYLNVKMFIW